MRGNGGLDYRENLPHSPESYPIARDRLLGMLLPQYRNRADKLVQTGKAFVRDLLRDRDKKEPTKDEVIQAFGAWKPSDPGRAIEWVMTFVDWQKRHIREARRVAGKRGQKTAFEKKLKKKL